jgi:hypothetical protein
LLSVIALAVGICILARRSKLLVKIVVAIIATPVVLAAFGALLMALFFISVDWNHHSQPSYSPGNKAAARIDYWGGFGDTGGSIVKIYTLHGFWMRTVFSSEGDLQPAQIMWKSDHEVVISYSDDVSYTECASTRSIHVDCVLTEP